MYTYLTHGSEYYMQRLIDNNNDRTLMKYAGQEDIILYEETTEKSVFSSPESFEVVESDGSMTDDAPLMLRYFQVSDERRKAAESRLTGEKNFAEYDGYIAYRLLRPLRGQTYCVALQFQDEDMLDDFRKSSVYREHYENAVLKQYETADFISNIHFTKLLRPITD
ncbi:antibiotic biosynthesis monooxygenase [Macrococcus lamae]|uniref:Signal transduction protein TRAP n=1 Tax=Macrococcus lamae TaxID=198484 RepID=A0A4R6BTK6_9STAP|nr:antibiotic biosynthesis monooxygenase [Macrococcus lamae]TDM07478.1 hypothetical protein ERX29_08515 [Macrococcus lamae]